MEALRGLLEEEEAPRRREKRRAESSERRRRRRGDRSRSRSRSRDRARDRRSRAEEDEEKRSPARSHERRERGRDRDRDRERDRDRDRDRERDRERVREREKEHERERNAPSKGKESESSSGDERSRPRREAKRDERRSEREEAHFAHLEEELAELRAELQTTEQRYRKLPLLPLLSLFSAPLPSSTNYRRSYSFSVAHFSPLRHLLLLFSRSLNIRPAVLHTPIAPPLMAYPPMLALALLLFPSRYLSPARNRLSQLIEEVEAEEADLAVTSPSASGMAMEPSHASSAGGSDWMEAPPPPTGGTGGGFSHMQDRSPMIHAAPTMMMGHPMMVPPPMMGGPPMMPNPMILGGIHPHAGAPPVPAAAAAVGAWGIADGKPIANFHAILVKHVEVKEPVSGRDGSSIVRTPKEVGSQLFPPTPPSLSLPNQSSGVAGHRPRKEDPRQDMRAV